MKPLLPLLLVLVVSGCKDSISSRGKFMILNTPDNMDHGVIVFLDEEITAKGSSLE